MKRCTQKCERGGEWEHGKCCYSIGIDDIEGNPLPIQRLLSYPFSEFWAFFSFWRRKVYRWWNAILASVVLERIAILGFLVVFENVRNFREWIYEAVRMRERKQLARADVSFPSIFISFYFWLIKILIKILKMWE